MTRRSVLNSRERAVTNDIMRMQSFVIADHAEALRWLLLAATSADSAGGVAVVEGTQTAPLTAVVLGGLLVRPEIAGTALEIEGGTLFAIDPTGDTGDDSPGKFVAHEGLAKGPITFQANPGPGVRIDVIECSIETAVFEADNRDLYNPATGGFTSVSVPKVKGTRLTYRVRRGTAGGGYPGHALGWLPLMVAAVPSTATNWDGCTCWDVRPLLADRIDAPIAMAGSDARTLQRNVTVSGEGGAATPVFVKGTIETSFGMWRAGGIIASDGISPTTTHAESGFVASIGTKRLWYLYACFPSNLPRWCEYTPAASGVRVPGGFRGIPLGSAKEPDAKGNAANPIVLPYDLGSTTNAVAIFAGGASSLAPSRCLPAFGDDEWIYSDGGEFAATSVLLTKTGADFEMPTGAFPPNAKAVWIDFEIIDTASGTEERDLYLSVLLGAAHVTSPGYSDPSDWVPCPGRTRQRLSLVTGNTYAVTWSAIVPTTAKKFRLGCTIGANGGTLAASSWVAKVRGWKV